MGLFTLQMQATGATITQLFGNPNLNSTFTITGGSLPLEFGETISGTHTGVDNNIDEYFGLNQGSVFMFMLNKDALVRYSVNGTLYVNQVFGSGTIELLGPIVSSADTISIDVRPATAYDIPTPALWYDATDATTLTLTNSGGTNYVNSWASKGSYSKTLTGATIQRPIYSASTTFPNSMSVVTFTNSSTAGERDYLACLSDSSFINVSGATIFEVQSKPTSTALSSPFRIYSGGTNGSYVGSAQLFTFSNVLATNSLTTTTNSGGTITNNMFSNNLSGYALNSKYLTTSVLPNTSGGFAKHYLNNFYTASTTPYVVTGTPRGNMITLNIATISSGGTITASSSTNEVGEIIYYDRELTQSEIYIVQHYLQNKWGYDNW